MVGVTTRLPPRRFRKRLAGAVVMRTDKTRRGKVTRRPGAPKGRLAGVDGAEAPLAVEIDTTAEPADGIGAMADLLLHLVEQDKKEEGERAEP